MTVNKKYSSLLKLVIINQLLGACSQGLSAQDYWQQQVNYSIAVSLNDKDRTLDGFCSMQYFNHSPDTLTFIWIHCWPNAFKNDETAFSEQLLGNGRTDFYFSDKMQRGYINRLDFRVDGVMARTEDHPQYIDIIRVLLPRPLPPGGQVTITTPFHEKLPYNFSRGGYKGSAFQLTQWYPKPAVYDKKGWHPIPYLDQGEFYSEFGNFDVRITVPREYVVAATGELQDATGRQEVPTTSQPAAPHPPATTPSTGTRTLQYKQDNIHDFAWFADKSYKADHDTLRLGSGRVIDIYAFYHPQDGPVWSGSTRFIKEAVRYRSSLIGEYPFNVITAAEIDMGSSGGMEYPTITGITPQRTRKALDELLEHEVGHNWFYAILGTNERRYPWMDEGINTYYDNRFWQWRHIPQQTMQSPSGTPKHPALAGRDWLMRKIPEDPDELFINTLAKEKRDQPISTASEDFSTANYDLFAYSKAAYWLRQLEDSLGTPLFDSCMKEYFRRWQFRHPYPEDFRSAIEATCHRNLENHFALLDATGPLTPMPDKRKIRPTFLFSERSTDKYSYINFFPAIGYNNYDHFMAGALIHNYNLPPDNFRFALAPLYATNSHQLNGIGDISYNWYPGPGSSLRKIRIGLGGARFSTRSGVDSNGHNLFGGFYKITPSLRIDFRNASSRSSLDRWIEWKTFLIGEKGFNNYVLKTSDSMWYPTNEKYIFRYLNQLSFNIADDRVLYPYRALFQIQQGPRFYRVNFTGNYFFNYAKGGGLDLRLFASKFGSIGNDYASYGLSAYQPKLTGVSGSEDYTYGNYFIGRNEYTGFLSQQIMMRDGDLKIRVTSFPWLEGRSDNWVSSLNLNSTLPSSIVPGWFPLKLFFDIGTYSGAWKDNAPTSRFLYVGGLQLSLFRNMINFYAPIVYSSDFSDQLKTVPDQNTFWKRLSFSVDIQNLRFRTLLPPNIPL